MFSYLGVGSNHSPIVISLDPKEVEGQKVFRFELMWTIEPQCLEVIAHNRKLEGEDDFENILYQNLEGCRSALTKWSKAHFPNNRKKVDSILNELQYLQNSNQSPEVVLKK